MCFLVLQDLENRDSTNLRNSWSEGMIEYLAIPRETIMYFTEIVGECLTKEQRAIYKRTATDVFFMQFRLGRVKINELAFKFEEPESGDIDPRFRNSEAELKMIWQMLADQFYKIEKALIKKIDLSGEAWAKGETYLEIAIRSYYIDGVDVKLKGDVKWNVKLSF